MLKKCGLLLQTSIPLNSHTLDCVLVAGKNHPISFSSFEWKLTLNFLKDLTITVKSQEDSQSEYYESTD